MQIAGEDISQKLTIAKKGCRSKINNCGEENQWWYRSKVVKDKKIQLKDLQLWEKEREVAAQKSTANSGTGWNLLWQLMVQNLL